MSDQSATLTLKGWRTNDLSLVPIHEISHFQLSCAPTRIEHTHAHHDLNGPMVQSMNARVAVLLDQLRAQRQASLLMIFQGMDASGKDGVIRTLFSTFDPLSMRMARFVHPTPQESAHDFLWRVHQVAPSPGELVLFNRSHYEEALVQRVRHGLKLQKFQRLQRHIKHFEELLADAGVCIVKCFLNISKKTQYERFKSRLEDPLRRWKLSPMDLEDRQRWGLFIQAYEDLMLATSKPSAPWFVVPADDKSQRDLYIAQLLLDSLGGMDISPPLPPPSIHAMHLEP